VLIGSPNGTDDDAWRAASDEQAHLPRTRDSPRWSAIITENSADLLLQGYSGLTPLSRWTDPVGQVGGG